MNSGFHYLNGKFVEKENCFLHITDLSIQRSYAVFDYFIYRKGIPLYLEGYLKRFRNSVLSMGIELDISDQELEGAVMELIRLNKVEQGGIKFIYTGGYAANGYDASKPNFVIMQLDFPIVPEIHYQKGVKLILEKYLRDFPKAKTTDYFFSLSLKKKLHKEEAFDVLYHSNGLISESSRSNFFIIDRKNHLVTTNKDILFGVTRNSLLAIASDLFEIEEREIHIDELSEAKEAFLTSTVKRVLPIVQIGEYVIGEGVPGSNTLKLRSLLLENDENYIIQKLNSSN